MFTQVQWLCSVSALLSDKLFDMKNIIHNFCFMLSLTTDHKTSCEITRMNVSQPMFLLNYTKTLKQITLNEGYGYVSGRICS